LPDIQQTTVEPQHTLSTILKFEPTPTSPKEQNSQQLKHRSSSTSSTAVSPVAKAKKQMTSRSSSTSSNPQTPIMSQSDGHHLRSRTSSFSNDHTATNDPVKVCTWTKCTGQKLTKAPKGSQMFHSPPLIKALKATKSKITAHISQDAWNKLHITHTCWDDYVSDSTSFYRPLMNTVVQQAFTAEIHNIGLEHDPNKTKLQRISASRRAHAIQKSWTCIEDDHLKGQVLEWEAPVDTQVLWTSLKKGTLVTCVRTPPNEHLSLLLGHTGTLLSGTNENTIRIQFNKEKILWHREHATNVTVREPKCLWSITDISPDANNHIVATVTPIKRNNSKNESRTI